MRRALRSAYQAELSAANAATVAGHIAVAFHHLERAHILSQRHTLEHLHVHWLMFRLGLSVGDWREAIGQSTRLVAAAIFSRIWVPHGNTGRAKASALAPMSIPDDLRSYLEDNDVAL